MSVENGNRHSVTSIQTLDDVGSAAQLVLLMLDDLRTGKYQHVTIVLTTVTEQELYIFLRDEHALSKGEWDKIVVFDYFWDEVSSDTSFSNTLLENWEPIVNGSRCLYIEDIANVVEVSNPSLKGRGL